VRNRLHAPESVKQNYLAWLIGSRNMLCVGQGCGSRGKTPAAPLEVNDIPRALFAGDYMHRAPCVDQHPLILLRIRRFAFEPETLKMPPQVRRTSMPRVRKPACKGLE